MTDQPNSRGANDPRSRSKALLDGRDRAPARAMLRAVGFSDDDFQRPLIGVANTWTEATPCNAHLRELGERVKEGVREAGGCPSSSTPLWSQTASPWERRG